MKEFFDSFKCPNCHSKVDNDKQCPLIDSIYDRHCSCNNATITYYHDNTNHIAYRFYCNLRDNWQIQIHSNEVEDIFMLIQFPDNYEVMDPKRAVPLRLDYIPELKWDNLYLLEKQLETMVTFQ